MSWLRFSILYFVVSAMICAAVGIPSFILVFEYWNLNSVAQIVILFFLFLTLASALLTVGFGMLNGGATQRRASAVVLVFLLSIFGIAISQAIGAVFGILLDWLMMVLSSLDAIILKFQYVIAVSLDSFYVILTLPSLPAILSIAVLGSFFGLPLARIGKGAGFSDAWSHQAGRRWMLFWRCGAGTVALSLIWTVVSYVAHSVFVKPQLTTSVFSDLETGLGQLLSYEPSFLERYFNLGMELLFSALAVGIVAYVAEHVRQQFG